MFLVPYSLFAENFQRWIGCQVKFEGRHVADNQVTAHGYADMIGPLDAGSYQPLGVLESHGTPAFFRSMVAMRARFDLQMEKSQDVPRFAALDLQSFRMGLSHKCHYE